MPPWEPPAQRRISPPQRRTVSTRPWALEGKAWCTPTQEPAPPTERTSPRGKAAGLGAQRGHHADHGYEIALQPSDPRQDYGGSPFGGERHGGGGAMSRHWRLGQRVCGGCPSSGNPGAAHGGGHYRCCSRMKRADPSSSTMRIPDAQRGGTRCWANVLACLSVKRVLAISSFPVTQEGAGVHSAIVTKPSLPLTSTR